MFHLLFILLGTHLMYKNGMEFMLKARIVETQKAEDFSYMFFMLAGLLFGGFVGRSFAYGLAPDSPLIHVACGTLSAILIGEVFFHYNKRLTRKIMPLEQRKNY